MLPGNDTRLSVPVAICREVWLRVWMECAGEARSWNARWKENGPTRIDVGRGGKRRWVGQRSVFQCWRLGGDPERWIFVVFSEGATWPTRIRWNQSIHPVIYISISSPAQHKLLYLVKLIVGRSLETAFIE